MQVACQCRVGVLDSIFLLRWLETIQEADKKWVFHFVFFCLFDFHTFDLVMIIFLIVAFGVRDGLAALGACDGWGLDFIFLSTIGIVSGSRFLLVGSCPPASGIGRAGTRCTVDCCLLQRS